MGACEDALYYDIVPLSLRANIRELGNYSITFDYHSHVMVIYEAKHRQKAYGDRHSNPKRNLRAIKEEYGRERQRFYKRT